MKLSYFRIMLAVCVLLFAGTANNTRAQKAELVVETGHSGPIKSLSFSSNGRTLASGSEDDTIKLWDVATGKELCSLIALNRVDWVVTTRDGRFDTNKIEDAEGLHWVVSDDPKKSVPLDVFKRDYNEPKLLPRLIQCNRLNNCDREFRPLPNAQRKHLTSRFR